MNDITLIEHLSVDSLTEALQDAGYRVNRSGVQSAATPRRLPATSTSAAPCACRASCPPG